MSAPVYLDYAASWPVDPRVAEAMTRALLDPDLQANPSAVHPGGRRAALAMEQARGSIAAMVGADPVRLLLTSGATESDNLAVLGVARGQRDRGRHVITSRGEHRAVIEACRQLEREGFEVTWLKPERAGCVEPWQVLEALREDTLLVSVMHANNETGALCDLAPIGAACQARGTLLHVDAAQSAGKLPLDMESLGVDLLALTAHKLGGPKGIGALACSERALAALQPLQFGGGQERGLRSGTSPTHQVVGFGLAASLALEGMQGEAERVSGLRERLWSRLQSVEGAWRNSPAGNCLPGTLNLGFEGVEGESLMLAIRSGVWASSGSACASASAEPSYVLRSMGLSDLACQASLRLSLGRWTDAAQVDRAAALIAQAVERLRQWAPLGVRSRIR